jgi:hypothetical protein
MQGAGSYWVSSIGEGQDPRQSPRAFISRQFGLASAPTIPQAVQSFLALAAQQIGQLGDVGCDPPGLVVREHVGLPGFYPC